MAHALNLTLGPLNHSYDFRRELLATIDVLHSRARGVYGDSADDPERHEEDPPQHSQEKKAKEDDGRPVSAYSSRPPTYRTNSSNDCSSYFDGARRRESSAIPSLSSTVDPPARLRTRPDRADGQDNGDAWAGKYRCDNVPVAEISPEPQYPKGARLALMMTALWMTISLVALDSTIVSTATPTLISKWHSMNDLGWYGAAYLLPVPTLQPAFGKAYPYGNTKYGFLSGLGLFEVGSLICALSQSSKMFIIGRTIAGIGAALLAPGVMLIVTDTVPKAKRPLFTGFTALAAGTAACLGPILGGVLTTRLSWRWCFYINLPLGALAALVMSLLYTPQQRKPKGIPFREILLSLDLPGCALLSGSVISLLLAFSFAAEASWTDTKVIVLAAMSGALLIGLIIEQALVDPRRALLPRAILKRKGIIIASIFGFLIELGSSSHNYYLPFYFQGVKGATAQGSGVDILPYLLSQTTAGIVTGVIVTLTGYFNPPMLFGTVMFAIGSGLLHTLSATSSVAQQIGYQIAAAVGAGCGQFMAMGIAQQLLEKDEEAIGLPMVYMIKTLGSAISISLSSTIFSSKLRSSLQGSGLSSDMAGQVMAGFLTRTGGALEKGPEGVVANAVAGTIDKVFILPIVSSVLALLVAALHEWRKIEGPGKAQ